MYCLVSYYSSYKQSVEELHGQLLKNAVLCADGQRIMNCSWQQSSLKVETVSESWSGTSFWLLYCKPYLGVGSSSPRCQGRGQCSVQLVPLFPTVTSWAAELVLGWTCRPAVMPEIFLVVTVDEPSALTSSGLVTTALRWPHLLPFPCFKMWQQHVAPMSSESILMLS